MISTDVPLAKKYLEAGRLVAIPTETVYGLAANAFDIEAVTQIFEVKNRPTFDPLIIHTDSLYKIRQWVEYIPNKAMCLAQAFWPGALTLLLPRKSIIPDLVTSGSSKVAVRIPAHNVTLELLKNIDFPLAAPSANPFGYISPTCAQHVDNQLYDKIPMILDGGSCRVGVESTIVDCTTDTPTVLRKGGIEIERIESIIGEIKVYAHSSSNPLAPGMLKSHYAPRKQLIISDAILDKVSSLDVQKVGVLSFQKYYKHDFIVKQYVLSGSGDYQESARNLFAFLRALDNTDVDIILTELLPEKSLGRAINDRLRRAATVS